MDKEAGGGTSLDLLKRLARTGNKAAIKALKVNKAPPVEVAHILRWYIELRRQTIRGFRFEPIQLTEIEAYGRLFHLEINPWEVEMLLDLDAIWQKAQPEPRTAGNDNGRRR